MSSRSKKKKVTRQLPPDVPNPIRIAIAMLVQRIKQAMNETGDWPNISLLWLIDSTEKYQLLPIYGTPEDQYQQVRTLCNENGAVIAVYVVPGTSIRVDLENVDQSIDYDEVERRYSQQVQDDPSHCPQQTIECPHTVRVNISPCIFFYGASDFASLNMVLPVHITEDGFEFQECTESCTTNVKNSSGNVLPNGVWFEGVEWHNFENSGASINPILN